MSVNTFGKLHNKWLAAIITLPKTTLNTSTLNTGETSSNYPVKHSLCPHKSSHGTFLDSHMPSRFIQVSEVNQRLQRSRGAPFFKTIFNWVFGLVRNQRQFSFRRIDFTTRTYYLRPKFCYCPQQSSQYPILPCQALDQSFTHLARNESKYEKILDLADFARRENCSFIRLNDVFRKTLLKAAKKILRQPTMRTEFSLIHVLISNCYTERIMGSYEKLFLRWGMVD